MAVPAPTLTVEQAQQILAGSPSQDELFIALLTLADQDEVTYVAALPRAQEILSELTGQDVSRSDINSVVRQLQAGEPLGQEVTISEAPVEGLPETAVPETAPTTVGAPPPVPPEEQPEPEFQVPPIGVPPGFQAEREFVGIPGDIGVGPGGTRQQVGVPPRYNAGDEFQFQYASTQEIRRTQKELEAAGLLEPGSFTPGFWDQASANALGDAMGFANRGGTTFQDVITELKQLPRQFEFEDAPEFDPPQLVAPDPATIEQRVISEFRTRLGREPTSAELAEFGGFLTAQHGVAQEAGVAAARQQFASANFSEIASALGDPTLSEEEAAELRGLLAAADDQPVQDVDPAARFARLFDERFGPEERFIEGQRETAENMNNVFSSLTTMGRLIG